MQIQKDEIKNKIIEAALEEFLISGYKQSSMRNIAEQAGITVGNIYSYFSGKDDLFENVVGQTVEQLKNLVIMKIADDNPVSNLGIEQITRSVATVFLENRVQFLILMNGSLGSKFENVKASLIDLVCERLNTELIPRLHISENDTLLADSLAVALIEGVINIFNKYGGDQARFERLFSEFLTVIFGDVFTSIKN